MKYLGCKFLEFDVIRMSLVKGNISFKEQPRILIEEACKKYSSYDGY